MSQNENETENSTALGWPYVFVFAATAARDVLQSIIHLNRSSALTQKLKEAFQITAQI